MRSSLGVTGLLSLAFGSTGILSLPTSEAEAHVVSVERDWDSVFKQAGDARGSCPTGLLHTRATSSSSHSSHLDYTSMWYLHAKVGGKQVSLVFDTYSADTWVVGPKASAASRKGVAVWDPAHSEKTTLMKGYKYQGYATGNVYKAPVCVGTACTFMAVASAYKSPESPGTFHSGMMGLAFQGDKGSVITPKKQKTFMQALIPKVKEPIFVTKLGPLGVESQISFGGNPFKYVAPMQKITVDRVKYPSSWSFVNVRFSKDGQHDGALGSFDIFFGTTSVYTTASERIVRGYFNGVKGAKDVNKDATRWTVPCGTRLPGLTMRLGDALLYLPGDKFLNGNTAQTGDCLVYLRKELSGRGFVGDAFFTQHVVVFNQHSGTIQWANQY